MDPYISLAASLLKAWQTRKYRARLAIMAALFNVLVALGILGFSILGSIEKNLATRIAIVFGGIAAALGIAYVTNHVTKD